MTRWRCACAAVLVVLACIGIAAQRGRQSAPGDHLLYIGTYMKDIQIFDEKTGDQVGAIPLQVGLPRSLTLSHDRSKFYVMDATFEKVEIVDIARRTTVDVISVATGNEHARIRRRGGLQVDPLERFLLLAIGNATKLRDRWEIGDVQLQQFDLAQKKIVRTIPWPDGQPRESMTMRFSPDGKLLYFFGDDVLILETENFTQVDRWALGRPTDEGFARMATGAVDDINDEPGYFTGLFTVDDPISTRRIMGLGRVNLAAKSFDFTPIGPPASVSFALTPDRRRAFGILDEVGNYQFWRFDVQQRRLVSRTNFQGRSRMALRMSSAGTHIYVYQAGETIDVYDAENYERVRTIRMNADQITGLFVLPRPRP